MGSSSIRVMNRSDEVDTRMCQHPERTSDVSEEYSNIYMNRIISWLYCGKKARCCKAQQTSTSVKTNAPEAYCTYKSNLVDLICDPNQREDVTKHLKVYNESTRRLIYKSLYQKIGDIKTEQRAQVISVILLPLIRFEIEAHASRQARAVIGDSSSLFNELVSVYTKSTYCNEVRGNFLRNCWEIYDRQNDPSSCFVERVQHLCNVILRQMLVVQVDPFISQVCDSLYSSKYSVQHIGIFVFLRYLNPAIIVLCSHPEQRKVLVAAARVLQKLANGIDFDTEADIVYNTFLGANRETIDRVVEFQRCV